MDLFEFPITVEDEELPNLGDRIPQAVELAQRIGRYGGCFVVLIHPNILGHKLEFEKRFVEGVKPLAWFGSISQFGEWWAARNEVALDIAEEGERYQLTLRVSKPISGLTLEVPQEWTFDTRGAAPIFVEQIGQKIILHEVRGTSTLRFSRTHGGTPKDKKSGGVGT